MSEELKTILDKLEIVARKHTIEVCEDSSKIETMPANIVDELRLNNYSSKLLLNYIQQKENIIKEVREKIKEDNLYLEEAKKMYIEDADDEMLKIHALQLINNDLSHIDTYLKILDKENK